MKKKVILIASVLVAIALASLAWTLCKERGSKTVKVGSEIAVRTRPNASSPAICNLHQGEKVTVLDSAKVEEKLWYFVETPKCLFGKCWHGWVPENSLANATDIQEFPKDQGVTAQTARLESEIGKLNLDFEQGPASSGRSWPAFWGGGGKGYEIDADNKTKHQGEWSCRIKSISDGDFGTVTGMLMPELVAGKRIRYSGYMKLENVTGFAGLWFRADVKGRTPAFDNMGGRNIHGTIGWEYYSFELNIPADTHNINLGALLAGKGTLWVDDINIEIIEEKSRKW